ncbi:MAG TPA: hypothetical protein VKE98_24365 [Gemmataceae bacterium]|nr:hypothetical protein [Gemmataceae bacterium]
MPSRIHKLLNDLAAAEDRFVQSEFLAPMLRGGVVRVRITGVIVQLKVEPAEFEGWGVFQPLSYTAARLIRAATLVERRDYLELIPALAVILCRCDGRVWEALPAHRGDRRFRIDGTVPVRLIEEAQLYETIRTRFDGSSCWYEGPDELVDPGAATYLRQAFIGRLEPKLLSRRGLTAEQRMAYTLNYLARLEAERDRTEDRLRDALAQAGAELRTYAERGDIYRVEYEVDGRKHVSVVNKQDLSVKVAGICLSGADRHFDLQSLVGVLREAGDHVVRVGRDNRGMTEDQYWHVHPPR